MSLKERIDKAESLDKNVRDKHLFEYLKLKSLDKGLNDDVKFEALARFVSEVTSINYDDLSKFINDFENDYKKNKKFNDSIFYYFVIYALKGL